MAGRTGEHLKGHQYWKLRKNFNIKLNPDELWEAACSYFEWVEANPIMTSETVKYEGQATLTEVPQMRAMTLQGFYLHAGITEPTFYKYEKKEAYADICQAIRAIIFEQKFTGAAAGALNHAIIIRELGLADNKKVDHQSSDGSMSPATMEPKARQKRIDELLKKRDQKL